MPGWLQTVSQVNPLTYEVDALRTLMLASSASITGGLGLDFIVLLVWTAVLIYTGSRLYPTIVR